MKKLYVFALVFSFLSIYSTQIKAADHPESASTCTGSITSPSTSENITGTNITGISPLPDNDTYTLTVTISNTTSIEITIDITTLAASDALTITDNNGTLYTGTTGDNLTKISATGTFTLVYDNSDTGISEFDISWTGLIASDGAFSNITCHGDANGTAQVFPDGGTSPYTYSWDSGETTRKITSLSTGEYKVTVTDNNSCKFDTSFTISEPTSISASISETKIACYGANDGTAEVSASGGSAPFTYNWSNSNTGTSATGLHPSTAYDCTVTDDNNCTTTPTITTSAQNPQISASISETKKSCYGANDGTAAVSASGGTGTLTYEWSDSKGTNSTATGLSPTTAYDCTVTDNIGCEATPTITTSTQNPQISTSISQTKIACYGANDGTAAVSASGGSGAFKYDWSDGKGTSNSATGLSPSVTYYCTITDDNVAGCDATQSIVVTQNPQISASISETKIACNGANDGTAEISASGGTGTLAYDWSDSKGTNSTATGLLPATAYDCTVTDNNNCTSTPTITTSAQNAAITASISETKIACNGANDGTAEVSASGGSGMFSYDWSNSDSGTSATGLSPATAYDCTVTDNNNCTSTPTITTSAQNAAITASISETKIACNGANDGTADVSASGGSLPFTYEWSNSNTGISATGLSPTTAYDCTVTDNIGCEAIPTITTSAQNAAITASISETKIACYGANDGTAEVSASGGTGPLTYEWSNSKGTNSTATGLSPTTAYDCTVTDNNSCTSTPSITTSAQNPQISTSISETKTSCYGANDGTAAVSASGGSGAFKYEWSDSKGTSNSATGLSPSVTYYCTITDDNVAGCDATQSIIVTQNPQISASISETKISCYGANDGTAEVSASGGSAPLTYNWSNSNTGTSATGLSPSTAYDCTVTDNNNCTSTPTITTSAQNPQISASISETKKSCFGQNNGEAEINTSGGSNSYTYSWDHGKGSSTSITMLDPTISYSCTVTDANVANCSISKNIQISENPKIAVANDSSEHNGFEVSCNGGSDAWAQVIPSGGTPGYSYQWDAAANNQTSDKATNLNNGTYNFTVTDANGCTFDSTRQVRQPGQLAIQRTLQNISSYGNNDGYAHITNVDNAAGNNTQFIYNWTGTNTNSGTGNAYTDQDNLTAGFYSVTVTDENGCQIDSTWELTQNTELIAGEIEINNSNIKYVCEGDSVFAFTQKTIASGGTDNYTFNWEYSTNNNSPWTSIVTGATDSTYTWINKITQDIYVRRIVDDGGTTKATSSVFLDFIPKPTLIIQNLDTAYCADNTDITIQGIPFYTGSVFSSDATITDNADGTAIFKPSLTASSNTPYNVEYAYTDSHGCKDTIQEPVYIRTVPTVSFSMQDIFKEDDPTYDIEGASPYGGTFSGSGVIPADSTFHPSSLTAGHTYIIKYTYSNTYGCSNVDSQSVDIVSGVGDITLNDGSGTMKTKYCIDGSSIEIKATPLYTPYVGSFTTTATDNGDNVTGTIDPTTLTAGTHDIKFEYTSGGNAYTITQTITVYDITDEAAIYGLNSNNTYCNYGQIIDINANELRNSGDTAEFSGFGVTDNNVKDNMATFSISEASANPNPIDVRLVYTHGESGCKDIETRHITINAKPQASFNTKTLFNSEGEIYKFQNIQPTGGIFNGESVSENDSTFNPLPVNPNSYTISYKYSDPTTQCKDTTYATVLVEDAKGTIDGIYDPNKIYCSDGIADTIFYTPADTDPYTPVEFTIDGIIMSSGSDTAVIIPDTLAQGNHTIKYSYIGRDGITLFWTTETIFVDDIETLTIVVANDEFCIDAPRDTLIGYKKGEPANWGRFSGAGTQFVESDNNGKASFTPSIAGQGTHEIIYTYKSMVPSSQCIGYDTINLTVYAKPTLSFNLSTIYNINGDNDTLQATPSGGKYSPESYFTNDSVFIPANAGIGNKTITYTYTDEHSCDNSITSNTKIEEATGVFNNVKTYFCYDEAVSTITVTGITNPTNAIGTFSGLGITNTGNNRASFNPQQAFDNASKGDDDSTATITITFEYKGVDNSTVFTKTATTKVRNNGEITINNLNENLSYCKNAEQVELTAHPDNGIFSGDGMAGSVFSPSNVSGNTGTITYTFTDNEAGCSISENKTITMLELPNPDFNYSEQLCSNNPADTLIGAPTGGDFLLDGSVVPIGNGDNDTVLFNPNNNIGIISVTYTYADANGCEASISHNIKVDTLPILQIITDMPQAGYCNLNEQHVLQGKANGFYASTGIFSGDGIVESNNNGKGKFNPNTASEGSFPITFSFTDNNGCNSTVDSTIIVNALPIVSISGLGDTAFCADANTAITLNGNPTTGIKKIFTIKNEAFPNQTQVDFTPSSYANKDSVAISYYNMDDKRCENTIIIYAKIKKVPNNDFLFTNICIAEPTTFTYSENTLPLDSVKWDFGDETTSMEWNPVHQYLEAKEVEVIFNIWAHNGCDNNLSKSKNLETSPNANFTWQHECEGETVKFKSEYNEDGLHNSIWNFGDDNSSTTHEPMHQYDGSGQYIIKRTVNSNNSSCKSIVTDTIYIRPVYKISEQNDYTESFEHGNGLWIPRAEDTIQYSWEYGVPNGNYINSAASGVNAYVTSLNSKYRPKEISSVTSPCFDFTDAIRPMISMSIFKQIENNRDGAIIEYRKDAVHWNILGTIDEGINWYNSFNIAIKPGEQSQGWTDSVPKWIEARHNLDKLIGTENLQFRILFAADDAIEYEGFAFDNIRVGERTRRVLVEHFTNTKKTSAVASNNTINNIINNLNLDAIDIQYHTSYNTDDQFYNDYPLGSSSREAYYNLDATPYTYFDGKIEFDFTNNNKPNSKKLMSEALTDPKFNMSIETTQNQSGISINLNIEARENINNRQMQLFVAIVEKSVTLTSSGLVFQNVLRRFLPNPGGTYINANWEKGTDKDFTFNYSINDYIANPDKLIVIAFIQDENNKKVLQTVTDDPDALTSVIEPWLSNKQELDFIIYPNPANNTAYFVFGKSPAASSTIQIINQNGKIIDVVNIPENTPTSYYELSGLPEGFYYVRWINNNQQKVKKLIVIH